MKLSLAFTAALMMAAVPAGLHAAGSAHNAFGGVVGVLNPCNGEGVNATGPIKLVYLEGDDHHVVHFSFKAEGVGSLGNTYRFSFEANGQFDAPTGFTGPAATFDIPVKGEVITKGGAPNFEWNLGIRVYVVGGTPVGAFFFGPSTTTCHG